MYGQIHCIIREMLQVKFGMDKWYEVLHTMGLEEESFFQVFSVYEDATTFKLLETATNVLGVPLNTVLKEFGQYFLTYCLKHGYDTMLLTLGQDMCSFINNLDSLHSMLSLSYRGIVAPSFRCEEDEDGTLTVHHYSWRNGLYPIVNGLLEVTAKELFNQVARMVVVESESVNVDGEKVQYHTAIKVELQSRSRGGGLVSGKSYNPNKPRILRRRPSVDEQLKEMFDKTSVITVEDQTIAYPYHILLDEAMQVLQCGESLKELVPSPITSGTKLTDFATISMPILTPTANLIRQFINSVFFISVNTGGYRPPFVLRGQFMWLPRCSCLLYMGSPHLLSWNDFKEMNVSMADIPLYDCTRELVLLNQQRIAEIDVAKRLDETTSELKRLSEALEAEKHKTEELLHEMMPRKVAMQLTLYGRVKAEKYDMCTVLFSDIVTFTDITGNCQADQVVNMLNDMYHRFDTHTEAHDVYKVETIGDAYMAVTGVPEFQEDHAERMADFAMDMLEEAANVPSPATGLPLQIRVGLHSGAVVAGVIGKKKPRFDIYGDTVNTASRMESNGIAGRIQVSELTFEKLYSHGYVFKSRGEIDIKGKGKVVTYFLVGTLDRDLYQPDDNFSSLPDVLDPEAETSPSRKKIVKRTVTSKRPNTINIVDNRVGGVRSRPSLTWQNLLGQIGQKPITPAKPEPPPPPKNKVATPPPAPGQPPEHYTATWNLCPPPESAFKDMEEPEKTETAPPAPVEKSVVSPPPVQQKEVVAKESPQEPAPKEKSKESKEKSKESKDRGSISHLLVRSVTNSRRHSVLKRIEPSPFLKTKRHHGQPKKMEPYTTQQMSLLPFGSGEEGSEFSSSFFEKYLPQNGCTML